MNRFVQGEERLQQTLQPNCLEDYVADDNPVRVVEVFIDELDLAALGFEGVSPSATGHPAYHPATLLKIYLYGYLNRIQSSRRLTNRFSLTDPDARSMATDTRGAGVVGYNVQTAVETEHHLIVVHEVTNNVTDTALLSSMATKAKAAMAVDAIDVVADRGYFNGEEVRACEALGVTPYVPEPLTSSFKVRSTKARSTCWPASARTSLSLSATPTTS